MNNLNHDGATPLLCAAYFGELGIVEALYEFGAEVNISDYNGATPVFFAAHWGQFDFVKRLHEMGAELDAVVRPNGYTALIVAAKHNNSFIVEYLLDEGVNQDIVDANGMSALGWARYLGFEGIVESK